MFRPISRRILIALAFVAVLSALLAATPTYAAGEGPLTNNAAPLYGQRIGWSVFQGAPTIVNGKTYFWVWNENVNGQNKLHIRTTTDGRAHTFTGTVTTGQADNFYNLAVVNNGGTDRANLVGYNQFNFSLATSGSGDGLDVDWTGAGSRSICSWMVFTAQAECCTAPGPSRRLPVLSSFLPVRTVCSHSPSNCSTVLRPSQETSPMDITSIEMPRATICA